MEPSIITALAAAGGSIVGGAATVTTSWINQRTQTVREQTQARLRERERLYGEFITEASRLAVDAVSHSLETLEQLVILYGILGRIRLISERRRSDRGRELLSADRRSLCEAKHNCRASPRRIGFRRTRPAQALQRYLPGGTFEDFAEFLMAASKQSKRILQNPSSDTKGDFEHVRDAKSIANTA